MYNDRPRETIGRVVGGARTNLYIYLLIRHCRTTRFAQPPQKISVCIAPRLSCICCDNDNDDNYSAICAYSFAVMSDGSVE